MRNRSYNDLQTYNGDLISILSEMPEYRVTHRIITKCG